VLPTIDRYLLKEVVLTFFATVLVLLAMVLSNRLAGYLNQVANGLLSKNAVFLLLGLQAINLLVILTPLSLLLSIMLALGRLYRDSEMIALTACGIGPAAVYRPLFLFAVPLAVVIAGFSLYVLPLCMGLQFELEAKARQEAEVSMFTPGTFRELADGQHVIYVGALVEGGKELRKIFIQSRTLEGIAITTGERGYQKIDSKSGARYVVLSDGYRYEGNPGQGDYRNLHFQQLSVRLESVPPEQTWRHQETIPTMELLDSTTPSHKAELHHRLSGPTALLVVALLAPLLARAQPREGRFGRVVAAVLIYAIYINLLEIGKSWLTHERAWPVLGLWWVHGLFASVGLGLWIYQYGISFQSFRRLTGARQTP